MALMVIFEAIGDEVPDEFAVVYLRPVPGR
jgi:hypothetical protein